MPYRARTPCLTLLPIDLVDRISSPILQRRKAFPDTGRLAQVNLHGEHTFVAVCSRDRDAPRVDYATVSGEADPPTDAARVARHEE